MKNVIFILLVFLLISCSTSRIYGEYEIYVRDNSIDFPKEKLTLQFVNDSIGLFNNTNLDKKSFTQTFKFSKVDNFLIIKSNPLGEIENIKIIKKNVGQDAGIQYLVVAKQNQHS